MALVVSRTDDSAIDMELSQLSNVQEEYEQEPQEMDTLMGKDIIEIEIPVPPELEMPRTPRMPMKTFADLKDPPALPVPASTSTPAPMHHQSEVRFKEIPERTDPEDNAENNCNNAEDDVENISEESGSKQCEDCKPVKPKTQGQFGLLLACIALSIIIGFVAGYFLREEKYKQERLEDMEDNVCVALRVPSALTKQQLQYHEKVVQDTSKTRLEEFARYVNWLFINAHYKFVKVKYLFI